MAISRRELLQLGTLGAAGAGLALGSVAVASRPAPRPEGGATANAEELQVVPTMCQGCSTVCGILGYVRHGRLVKIEGNPEDPISTGYACAKGQAGINWVYHPERLMHPLRRVGARGEGRWKRISWDEALDEMATRLRAVLDSGHPEEFVFHQGRNRSDDITTRFLNAFGTPTLLNHRSLCSSNHRAAHLSYIWEGDWGLNDVEHTKYMLNFGSNLFEAHQGHIAFASRAVKGLVRNQAKLVTFDVRLSNTAAKSHEWFPIMPGTDGLVALAMGQVIVSEGLYNREFLETWVNCSIDTIREHLRPYTPEYAEQESTVPAADIRRIAREFAAAAPRCTTISNRGAGAHINGFYNERAVIMLNALVGNIGKPGGWCFSPWGSYERNKFPVPQPEPPAPRVRSFLEDPEGYPLANVWNRMKVGGRAYQGIKEGKGRVQFYWSYNLDSPMTWPGGPTFVSDVLRDESIIPFHVALNQPFMTEIGALADIVLPWTTYLERWDVDARSNQDLKPYVSLRQPVVQPLGESRDLRDIVIDLAKRIGDPVAQYFQYGTTEDYIAHQLQSVPAGGFAYMREHGTWTDPNAKPYYEPHLQRLTPAELEGTVVDRQTGIILKGVTLPADEPGGSAPPTVDESVQPGGNAAGAAGQERDPAAEQPGVVPRVVDNPTDGTGVGIMVKGIPLRGFRTPSRKFELYSQFVVDAGRNRSLGRYASLSGIRVQRSAGLDVAISPLPIYQPIPQYQHLRDDQFCLTTFKWNVHTQGRTMQLKWLAELVHTNPAWINTRAAARYGIRSGDLIELTSYHPNTGAPIATLAIEARVTQGIHPKVIAISNSCGHWEYTNVAQGRRAAPSELADQAFDPRLADADIAQNLWWDKRFGGEGNGWNPNGLIPNQEDPTTGMQGWNDTVITIRKL